VRVTIDDAAVYGSTPAPLLLLDAVTPFGADAVWTVDITEYLVPVAISQSSPPGTDMTRSYTVFIGSAAAADGVASGTLAGFDVAADLVFDVSPAPVRPSTYAVPLLQQSIWSGAPALASVTAPSNASHVRLDLFSTGHGSVGPSGCDEFCQKENVVTVDGNQVFSQAPWTDCNNECTPVPGASSCGAWTFALRCQENPTACPLVPNLSRANWCPSQLVDPIAIPLDDAYAKGTHLVGFSVPQVEGSFDVGLIAVYTLP